MIVKVGLELTNDWNIVLQVLAIQQKLIRYKLKLISYEFFKCTSNGKILTTNFKTFDVYHWKKNYDYTF